MQDEEKQNEKHNTICIGHHYAQANTNNVNKTTALVQTIGDYMSKCERNVKKSLKIPKG
jgi:hypothetical protein